MPASIIKKLLAALGLSLLFISALAFAVPSLPHIRQTIAQRDWQQADTQLVQVIAAYPDNALAHYLYGQVLDHQGYFAQALMQLQRAQTLDPQLRFTTSEHFAQTEARLRSHARLDTSAAKPVIEDRQALPPSASAHAPSPGLWIGLIALAGIIALVLRRTLQRARGSAAKRTRDVRREQLKRTTDLLNALRSLKLDAQLSTAPGAAALNGEITALESRARALIETLSNSENPAPSYQLDELEHQFATVKARIEGTPLPNPTATASANSVFAQEAGQLMGAPSAAAPSPSALPASAQSGSGIGGLLGGLVLGEAMPIGRDRIIERDVFSNDANRSRDLDPGIDFGQGDTNGWDSSNGADFGNNSDGWNDN